LSSGQILETWYNQGALRIGRLIILNVLAIAFVLSTQTFAQAALGLSGGSYISWTKLDVNSTLEVLKKSSAESPFSTQLHQEAEALRKEIRADEILTTLQYWSSSALQKFLGDEKIPSEKDLQDQLDSEADLDIRWQAILIHTRSMQLLNPERYGLQLTDALAEARRNSIYQMLSHRGDRMRQFVEYDSNYLFLIRDEALIQAKQWVKNEPHKTEERMITFRRDFEDWIAEYRWLLDWLQKDAGFTRVGSEQEFENQLQSDISRIVFVAQLASRLQIQWSEADLQSIVNIFNGDEIVTLPPESVQVLQFQSFPSAQEDYKKAAQSQEIRDTFLDPTNNPIRGETNLFATGGLLTYWLLGKRTTANWHPVERPTYSRAQWQSVLHPDLPPGLTQQRLSELLTSSDQKAVSAELDQLQVMDRFRQNFTAARKDLLTQQELRQRIAQRSEKAATELDELVKKVHDTNARRWLESGRNCREPLASFGRGESQSPNKREAKQFAKDNFSSWFRFFLRKRMVEAIQRLKLDIPNLNLAQRLYLGSVEASRQIFLLSLLPPAFQGGRLLVFGPADVPTSDWSSTDFEDSVWKQTLESRASESEVREIAVTQLITALQDRIDQLNDRRKEAGLPELDLITGPEALSLNESVRVPQTDALLINGRVGRFYAAIVESNRDKRKTQRELLENAVILAFEMDFENKAAADIGEAGKVTWHLAEAANLEKASVRDQDLVIQSFAQTKILPEEMSRVFDRSYLIFFKR